MWGGGPSFALRMTDAELTQARARARGEPDSIEEGMHDTEDMIGGAEAGLGRKRAVTRPVTRPVDSFQILLVRRERARPQASDGLCTAVVTVTDVVAGQAPHSLLRAMQVMPSAQTILRASRRAEFFRREKTILRR